MFVRPSSDNWTMVIAARHKKSLGTNSANFMDKNAEKVQTTMANEILLVFDLTYPEA